MTDWIVTDGAPEPPGASADATGVNFAVFSAHAEAIAVCLFDASDTEVATLRLPARTGDVFHGHIAGVVPGARYGLRAWGPWDPAHGHRFNATKLLVDPFAVELDRPFRLVPALCDTDGPQAIDTAPVVPKAVVQGTDLLPLPLREGAGPTMTGSSDAAEILPLPPTPSRKGRGSIYPFSPPSTGTGRSFTNCTCVASPPRIPASRRNSAAPSPVWRIPRPSGT
jgi:glycogen operon protein